MNVPRQFYEDNEAKWRPKVPFVASADDLPADFGKLPGDVPESKLHRQIIAHCAAQWPRWKTIHARMDKPSGIEVGAHDFTVFLPAGRTVCIECKKKDAKLSFEQMAWRTEMERLGHTVFIVRSFAEFLAVVN